MVSDLCNGELGRWDGNSMVNCVTESVMCHPIVVTRLWPKIPAFSPVFTGNPDSFSSYGPIWSLEIGFAALLNDFNRVNPGGF